MSLFNKVLDKHNSRYFDNLISDYTNGINRTWNKENAENRIKKMKTLQSIIEKNQRDSKTDKKFENPKNVIFYAEHEAGIVDTLVTIKAHLLFISKYKSIAKIDKVAEDNIKRAETVATQQARFIESWCKKNGAVDTWKVFNEHITDNESSEILTIKEFEKVGRKGANQTMRENLLVSNEIKKQFELLQESYTPVNVIHYFDFLRTRPFGEVLENVSYVFTEPTKGISYIKECIEGLYPFPVDTLKEAATTMANYYNKASNGGYENIEHLESIRECITYMNEKISDYESNEVQYLREDTLKHLDMVFGPEVTILAENIGSMAPDIVYSDDETIPVLKKKYHKEFSKQFVNTFMDESDEINLESFNAMLRAGFAYDNLVEEEILTEGAVNRVAKRAAIAGDAVARKTANGMRRAGREGKRVKVIAKKIPGHFDKLADNTIGQIGKMDKAERRKRIVEGGFKFKLLKLVRNAILLGAAWAVSPALAAIGIIANLAFDRQLDRKVRGELLDDLELELKMTKEKIKDAESKNDNKKKYQLMRIENALERDIERIQYRLNTVKVSKKGVQV